MARSSATTVDAYLEALPAERRAVVSAVRDVIFRNLPQGYRETMNWGMISYEIPLESCPDTYNGQPLGYVGLGPRKNYCSLYLMGVYSDSEEENWLRDRFREAGKKLDMGKSRLRFRSLEDLELDAVARVVSSTSPEAFIAAYEASRRA